MKKLIFVATLTCSMLVGCNSFSNRGTVDRPFIESAGTNNLSFDKVELTDSSTVLHAVVHFRPGWWIQISPGSFIVADGDTLTMTSIDGITPGENFIMPDSGVTHFTMTFPAIAPSVRKIDFSEDGSSTWKIWGIDLTGKGNSASDAVPAALKAEVTETEIPVPEMTSDSATVNIHVTGYRPCMGSKINIIVNAINGQSVKQVDLDKDGNATFTTFLTGPANIRTHTIGETNTRGNAIVIPGETVDIYSSALVSGYYNMKFRGDENLTLPMGYASGKYAPLVRAINEADAENFDFGLYSGKFADYHMDGDTYTDFILTKYHNLKDSLAASDLKPIVKEYLGVNLDAQLIVAAQDAFRLLRTNYYNTHNSWGSKIPADSINIELSDANLKRVAGEVDFNNPLYLILFADVTPDDLCGASDMWEKAGADTRLIKELETYQDAYEAASNLKVSDEQREKLRSLSSQAYLQGVEAKEKEVADFMANARLELITPTPDVADDKVFDAIIAPHKGKVVMVDLWNTWCGPCRSALAANEPAKQGDLASDDIVWIYIADESSKIGAYLEMIPDIKGIHYRVTPEQINIIRSRFEVDGIPYYIIVDRNGKATGRPDLRNHDLFKKTLLEEVAKK